MSTRPTAIDLFSGAGGFSQGLIWSDFDVLWANDIESHCKHTYEHNHPDVEFACKDIRDIDPKSLPVDTSDLDLVVGGPPCPTHSKIGRGKINSLTIERTGEEFADQNKSVGFEDSRDPARENLVLTDDRHYLFEDFIRFVSELQPRAFLMENVPGMKSTVTESGENVVKRIKRKLRDMGYRVNIQELDAAGYGVPQRRHRLFFVGNRLDRENPVMAEWISHREPLTEKERNVKTIPTVDANQSTLADHFEDGSESSFRSFQKDRKYLEPWVTVGDAILDLPPVSPDGTMPPTESTEYMIPPVTEYQKWVRDIVEDGRWDDMELHNHECRGHNLKDLTLYKLLGEGVGWEIDALAEEFHPYRSDVFRDQYKKDDPREPASIILAHMQKDGHMSIHPREARSYTVREAARLQSFKDSFKFPVPRSQALWQVGNAVPPLLAEALVTAIRVDVLTDDE